MRAAAIGLGWVMVVVAACGDDAAPPGEDAGARDAAAMDASPPDAGRRPDAGVPVDAGPPPSCDVESSYVTFAEGFDGTRDDDPGDFAPLRPGGPWAFAYRVSEGVPGEPRGRAEITIVDATGAELGRARLQEVSGDREAVADVRVRAAAGGALAVWTYTRQDAEGAIEASEVRHAAVGTDGAVTRAAAVLYERAGRPFLATAPPSEAWVQRSDIQFSTGTLTGVVPRIQALDGEGAPTGADVDLSAFLRVEAADLFLRTHETGLALVYRVPPSAAFVVPMMRTGGPTRTPGMIDGVPRIDDVAAYADVVAIAHTQTLSGTARVGLVLTSHEGRLRTRVALDELAADHLLRVAVVKAWPGFVALWRRGVQEDAAVWAAGVDVQGAVVVPPAELLATPDAGGDLFAVTDGSVLTLASRARPADRDNMLSLGRVCVPTP